MEEKKGYNQADYYAKGYNKDLLVFFTIELKFLQFIWLYN